MFEKHPTILPTPRNFSNFSDTDMHVPGWEYAPFNPWHQ